MSETPPRPGETRPHHLDRPPGYRYGPPGPDPPGEADHLRSLLAGAAVGAATAVVMGLLRSVLDLSTGLLAVAAFGGWGVGAALRWGAWHGRPQASSWRGALVAGALAAATWITWLAASWIIALAIRQGSTLSLGERLEQTPFLDWLGPQLGLLELGALLVLVVAAAYGARDR